MSSFGGPVTMRAANLIRGSRATVTDCDPNAEREPILLWRMSPLPGAADRSAPIGVNLRARPMAAGAGGWLWGAGYVVVELAQRIGVA